MPTGLLSGLEAPRAPRFLRYGSFTAGFALECNTGPAGEADFRVDQHIVGLSLGAPHWAEFAIESDRSKRLRMRAGHLQVIPAGHRHRVRWDACDFTLLFIAPELLGRLTAELTDGSAPAVTPMLQMDDMIIRAVITALRDEALSEGLRGSLYAEALVVVAAARLARLSGRVRALPAAETLDSPERLGRVYDYIEAHLDERMTIEELGSLVGMGSYRFARAFRRTVGSPPHRYVLERRIERAKRLLAETDLPITEIALMVGFASHSHLSTAFRQAVGASPKDFRKKPGPDDREGA